MAEVTSLVTIIKKEEREREHKDEREDLLDPEIFIYYHLRFGIPTSFELLPQNERKTNRHTYVVTFRAPEFN